jgi:hypothetical protein
VKAGDTVLATDPQTGQTRPEKVQKVIVTRTDEDFTDLSISSPKANSPPQKLTTTWHHPFWDATHHQWTDASKLTPGTKLRQPDGTTATIVATRNYHHHAVTYDLTIADLHTYYVLAGTTPVLVHNNNGASCPIEVTIDKATHPESAQHIEDAQAAGHPDVLTIDRGGARANRKASLKGSPKVPGKQLDEYPPAMFKEGGAGASVRAIDGPDNGGAGARIGNLLRGYADGTRVRIRVIDSSIP